MKFIVLILLSVFSIVLNISGFDNIALSLTHRNHYHV